jgi:hypothetical protein
MKRQRFGRRTTHQEFSQAVKPPAGSRSGPYSERTDVFENVDLASRAVEGGSVDDELDEWKRARREHLRLPWRQIAFMASLCFGVGSLVLPDTVNHIVQWALFALGAISLVAGFSAGSQPTGRHTSRPNI